MSDPAGTALARELFFNQGRAADEWLAPHISRSWARSRSAGVWDSELAPLGNHHLRERREAARQLLVSAQPELDALAEHATGHGCVVIVTDASGVILDEIGSPDFLPKAQRVALLPGVEWSERQCGTNAIGTVLVERQPLAVLGGEHFLAGHGGLGCAASPIFTGRGDIAGVLDISGDTARIDGHTLGLVRMASQQIEHRMMLALAEGDLLRFHDNSAVLGSAREGLVAVRDGRIVAINRQALSLLGQRWDSALDRAAGELFGERWDATGAEPAALVLPGGRTVVASLRRERRPGAELRAEGRATTTVAGTGSGAGSASAAPARQDGEDPAVARALEQAARVLDAGVAVLVTGETGAGKEVFARRLHAASRRRGGPLVVVNCAALPESLIEAELFGYEDGAFTGARRRGALGRIREAHGGTLLLDEIGDMPLLLQTRLLRVLEDRVVTPLGGGRATAVEFQLVCLTHRDLPAMVSDGGFRADLLFRVNGHQVHLPALRARSDQRALMHRLFAELGGAARGLRLSDEAVEALQRHRWPGNVRELVAVLRTSIALAGDEEVEIGVERLPASLRPEVAEVAEVASAMRAMPAMPTPPERGPMPLAHAAQHAIETALAAARGNVARAARVLGVHRSTVYRYLRRGGGPDEQADEQANEHAHEHAHEQADQKPAEPGARQLAATSASPPERKRRD